MFRIQGSRKVHPQKRFSIKRNVFILDFQMRFKRKLYSNLITLKIYMHPHQSTLRKGVFFWRPKLVLWFDRYFCHNQNKERNIKNNVGFCGWFLLMYLSKTFSNLLTPKLKTGIRLYTVFPHMRPAVTENKEWVLFECGYNSREGLMRKYGT